MQTAHLFSNESFSLIGTLGTLLALGLAIWQTMAARGQTKSVERIQKDAQAQTDRIEKIHDSARVQTERIETIQESARVQTKSIEKIQASLSTRYLNTFPDFFKDVVRLIQRTNGQVLVLCDVPAYACFSSYRTFLEYESALKLKLAEGIPLKMLFLGEMREKTHFEQFPRDETTWREWKERNPQKFDEFARRQRLDSVDDLTPDAFYRALSETHEVMLSQFKDADVRFIDIETTLSLHFWVIDSREAIFSIPSYAEAATEHGFYTSDPRLVAAFESMFDRLQRQARKAGEKAPDKVEATRLYPDPQPAAALSAGTALRSPEPLPQDPGAV